MTSTAPCLPRNRAHRQRRIAAARQHLPSPATMSARILAVWGEADDAAHIDGAAWYGAARRIAETVGALASATSGVRYADETSVGAGIIAALSPQTSWDENIARALSLADGEPTGAIADATAKAQAIMGGHHPLDVLGGRKVRSFYHNIVGRPHYVTVDRHALAIVLGHPPNAQETKLLERCGVYATVAAVYRAVARDLGLEPSALQAICWLAWRHKNKLDDTAVF